MPSSCLAKRCYGIHLYRALTYVLLTTPGSRGVADIMSVTMPLLSIKDLAVAISTRAGPAEDDPPLYK